jgi:glycerol-3-phosphate dehydrogenase
MLIHEGDRKTASAERLTPSLDALSQETWDVLVVGGGILGAAVMCEAARIGLRVLMVDQSDFASGTSSRSSKLVHGGLHYLMRYQFGMAIASVRERERLLRDAPGLVEHLNFLVPVFAEDRLPDWLVKIGLGTYEALARRARLARRLDASVVAKGAPGITLDYERAYVYGDAKTDDARVVLRVIDQGRRLGGEARNYVRVDEVLRNRAGKICGARIRDRETGCAVELSALTIVNATGPWAEDLLERRKQRSRFRLVRGSHVVISQDALPLTTAVAAKHPITRTPMYFIPWQGATVVGTTSVAHDHALECTPTISQGEADYLLTGTQTLFPAAGIDRSSVVSTFAGVRPIVDFQSGDLSKAARDHLIWDDDGMVTVAGGKLTLFRPIALEILRKLRTRLPEIPRGGSQAPALDELPPMPADQRFDAATSLRLLACYGLDGLTSIANSPTNELTPIPGLGVMPAELRWIARSEQVVHLEDLLLRRVRVGLTVQEGGVPWLDPVRDVVQPELQWDDERWNLECALYGTTWTHAHGIPQL